MINLSSEAVKVDVELRVVLKRLLDLKTEIEKKLEALESQAKPLEEQELHDALEKISDLIGKIRFHALDKMEVLSGSETIDNTNNILKGKVYIPYRDIEMYSQKVKLYRGPYGGIFYYTSGEKVKEEIEQEDGISDTDKKYDEALSEVEKKLKEGASKATGFVADVHTGSSGDNKYLYHVTKSPERLINILKNKVIKTGEFSTHPISVGSYAIMFDKFKMFKNGVRPIWWFSDDAPDNFISYKEPYQFTQPEEDGWLGDYSKEKQKKHGFFGERAQNFDYNDIVSVFVFGDWDERAEKAKIARKALNEAGLDFIKVTTIGEQIKKTGWIYTPRKKPKIKEFSKEFDIIKEKIDVHSLDKMGVL